MTYANCTMVVSPFVCEPHTANLPRLVAIVYFGENVCKHLYALKFHCTFSFYL